MSVTSTRLMSPEELELLATPLSITLERAADSGDDERIAWVVEQMNQETLAIYDAYVNWINVLQRFIVERAGEAGHDLAITWVAEHGIRPFVQQFAGLSLRDRVIRLTQFLRGAGSTFSVTEDDEKLRFECEIWGPARWWREPEDWQGSEPRHRAGDRYRYPAYGHYGPPVNAPVLHGARPLTRGRETLPAHLALEVLFLETIPIELFGAPLAVIGLGDTATEPVTLDVYKDDAAVPQAAYDAVGLARPAVAERDPEPGRAFDDDELERLGTPLPIQVEQAAEAGDQDRLREIAARMDEELVRAKDPLGVVIAGLLSWIARRFGEDGAERALEETAEVVMAPFVSAVRDLERSDAIRAWSVAWRSHGSTFWIEEDDERFIFRGFPLGACARMWASASSPEVERISDDRVRYPTFGSFDAPAAFHVMREPRGITHGQTGYPVYSCHCVMLHEIYPIDQLGYPLWVEQHPLDDRDAETVHIHYKDHQAWPDRYYEAVGRTKPASA